MAQTYDPSGNLLSITGTKGGTTLTSYAYTYQQGTNDRALRQQMTTGTTTTAYCYDVVNRLTGAATTGSCTSSGYQYTYDGNGNRQTASVNGMSVWATPSYNAVNELTALGSQTFGYDGNGNETGRSSGITAFGYNAKNQTVSITASGTMIPMSYTGDSQVQRINVGGMSGTNYVYTALGLDTQTSGGTTTAFIRTVGGRLVSERIGSASYYYLFDGLGSVVALTDSSGAVVDTYSYDPYGQVTPGGGNSVANPWQYTGGYYDSGTGLVKLGQRYYDPYLGRFTQLDPRGGGYVYASDNPVNFVDPSGLDPTDPLSQGAMQTSGSGNGGSQGDPTQGPSGGPQVAQIGGQPGPPSAQTIGQDLVDAGHVFQAFGAGAGVIGAGIYYVGSEVDDPRVSGALKTLGAATAGAGAGVYTVGTGAVAAGMALGGT